VKPLQLQRTEKCSTCDRVKAIFKKPNLVGLLDNGLYWDFFGVFGVNGVATLAKTLLVFYSWAPTSMGQWWRLPQEKNSSQGAAF